MTAPTRRELETSGTVIQGSRRRSTVPVGGFREESKKNVSPVLSRCVGAYPPAWGPRAGRRAGARGKSADQARAAVGRGSDHARRVADRSGARNPPVVAAAPSADWSGRGHALDAGSRAVLRAFRSLSAPGPDPRRGLGPSRTRSPPNAERNCAGDPWESSRRVAGRAGNHRVHIPARRRPAESGTSGPVPGRRTSR